MLSGNKERIRHLPYRPVGSAKCVSRAAIIGWIIMSAILMRHFIDRVATHEGASQGGPRVRFSRLNSSVAADGVPD
jgi:hypothetical protein